MPGETSPVELFFSYAHEDAHLRDLLAKHLRLLERQGVIKSSYDRGIVPGQEWDAEIKARLESAGIILLLVSADFLASDYSWSVEVQTALARHAAGTAQVIPVILRPCDWQSAPFGDLQALPRDGKPITTWSNRDEAFLDVARGIREAAGRQAHIAVADADSAASKSSRTVLPASTATTPLRRAGGAPGETLLQRRWVRMLPIPVAVGMLIVLAIWVLSSTGLLNMRFPNPLQAGAGGKNNPFSGTWSTNFATLVLDQQAGQVTGRYTRYGETSAIALQGKVTGGNKLTGQVALNPPREFSLTLAQDGRSINGNWTDQDGQPYQWCGVRSDAGSLPPGCGFSGSWKSIGDYPVDYPPTIQLTQTGSQLQGSFRNGKYAEPGTVSGHIGTTDPHTEYTAIGKFAISGAIGDFRWTLVDHGSQQFRGYSMTSDGKSHQWCGWRETSQQPAPCFQR